MIAGAGIGGMLLANGLAKAGAEVHLYEKSDRLRVSGGPILIQSNALASIEAINRTIAREAMRVGTINACRVNGTRRARGPALPPPRRRHAPAERTARGRSRMRVLRRDLNVETSER
jgi:2-polyprenyl-6-methoxyphenol hydroxylase-like FAD-dependent oxidoreductase